MSKNILVPAVPINPELRHKLKTHLSQLNGKKILIIGDVGVDEYIMGEVRRISPEAPVPVLEVSSEDTRLGLAANVAQNIRALGGEPHLISVVGADSGAELLRLLLLKSGVAVDNLVTDNERPTTRKARVMAKHHHLVRVDYEKRFLLSEKLEAAVLSETQKRIAECDAVILQDYAKGVVTPKMVKDIYAMARAAGKKVYVDPHRLNSGEYYAGCDLIKPNFDEAVALSGLNFDDLRDPSSKVLEVGRSLQRKTGAKQLVMTRGKDGMTIFSGDEVLQVPTFARQVFDVTGAGDTVIAALTLGLASGLSLAEACVLANFAAGVVVGQVGCVPCSQTELSDAIDLI